MTGLTPLKKFGQHFLVDDAVLKRLVDACSFKSTDEVLEIGSGPGGLTREIFPLVKSLATVEADARFADSLRQDLQGEGVTVHHADILTFDFRDVVEGGRIKVVGNIPYNISTPIIEKMLEERARISSLFLTVQFEFGARLTAPVGTKDYSALTCLINFFAVPRVLFRISSRAFRPPPKVGSCFMQIDFRRELPVLLKDEKFFVALVRTAFFQRRKTIANALKSMAPGAALERALALAGIQAGSRPEQVRGEEYAKLANILSGD